MSESIIPGAVTVAVTSGKGGVGKSTTTVALATALAADGHDVLVIDGDLDGPNVHLLAELGDVNLGVDTGQLTVTLPRSRYGFRVATPASVHAADPKARVSATDLIAIARFADPAQVVIVDLPPGWTTHHERVCHTLPDLVVAVAAPTGPSISDHRRHLKAWKKEWAATCRAIRDRDKRRKIDLPAEPTVVAVETLARFTGIPETGGDPVTVRRVDAVDAATVDKLVAPFVSVPSAASLAEMANGPEIGKIAALVAEHLGA